MAKKAEECGELFPHFIEALIRRARFLLPDFLLLDRLPVITLFVTAIDIGLPFDHILAKDERSTTLGARLLYRLIPGSKFTFRKGGATIEDLSLLCLFPDDRSFTFEWTRDACVFPLLLGISAFGKIGTSNECSILS